MAKESAPVLSEITKEGLTSVRLTMVLAAPVAVASETHRNIFLCVCSSFSQAFALLSLDLR